MDICTQMDTQFSTLKLKYITEILSFDKFMFN